MDWLISDQVLLFLGNTCYVSKPQLLAAVPAVHFSSLFCGDEISFLILFADAVYYFGSSAFRRLIAGIAVFLFNSSIISKLWHVAVEINLGSVA